MTERSQEVELTKVYKRLALLLDRLIELAEILIEEQKEGK